MKYKTYMKRIILFLSLMSFGAVESIAANPNITTDAISVNGLIVGQGYTQEQIEQALGKPTTIVPPSEFDEYQNLYIYNYGADRFYCIDGKFYGFELKTSQYAVNGLMRVGSAISQLDQLGGIKKFEKTSQNIIYNWRPSDKGLYEWLSVDFYCDRQKTVTFISAFIQDL